MSKDLNSMSRGELEKLRADVDKALESLEARKKAEAMKAIAAVAKEHGFTVDEVLGGASVAKTRGRKAAKSGEAKYRNPANPSQTWTGRGRQPGWIKEGLAAGKSAADFAI
jgi:DNA-binding protein H-NS